MTEPTPHIPPQLPGQDVVIQTAVEAAYKPPHEQEEHREIVSELVHELVQAGQIDLIEREQLMSMYEENMRLARGETLESKEQQNTRPVTIDADKIDWITQKGSVEVPGEIIVSDDLEYTFVDLTDFNGATRKAKEELAKQTTSSGEVVLDKVMEGIKHTYLPKMYRNVLSGQGVRTYNRTGGKEGKERAATDYPAYKIAAQGTHNRALALIIDGGEKPVLALAAVFDHDSDMAVYRALR